MVSHPLFKGYIHDLGGPTANFQGLACDRQLTYGPCPAKECLWPTPCDNLKDYHARYLDFLESLEAIKGVKKVFIRSVSVTTTCLRSVTSRPVPAHATSGTS